MWSVTILAAGAWVGLPLLAQAAQRPPGEAAVERLLSEDRAAIREAERELLAARGELVDELIAIVRTCVNDPAKEESAKAAMRILGEMRAVEAAEVLASYVAFPQVVPYDPGGLAPERGGLRHFWPAAEALLKIGDPAIPRVVAKVPTTDDITEQRTCLAVLVKLTDGAAVRGMLTQAINLEQDGRRRARLEVALNLLPGVAAGTAGPRLEDPPWLRPTPPGRPAAATERRRGTCAIGRTR